VNKTVTKLSTFAEPEKADREFYKKLSDNERLQVLVDRSGFQPLSDFHFIPEPLPTFTGASPPSGGLNRG